MHGIRAFSRDTQGKKWLEEQRGLFCREQQWKEKNAKSRYKRRHEQSIDQRIDSFTDAFATDRTGQETHGHDVHKLAMVFCCMYSLTHRPQNLALGSGTWDCTAPTIKMKRKRKGSEMRQGEAKRSDAMRCKEGNEWGAFALYSTVCNSYYYCHGLSFLYSSGFAL